MFLIQMSFSESPRQVASSTKMATTLNPEKALIFRIIHRDNLPWILDHGLHSSNGEIADPNYRNIGNVDLIGRRNQRKVRVGPGGALSDYVPFYFTPFSIMMYNIHTGYNVRQVPNEEILIVVSSLAKIGSFKFRSCLRINTRIRQWQTTTPIWAI